MKIAIYARGSTHNGQDPEMQQRELREYCQRRGWEITREYVDVGISGGKEKRPELDELLRDAHHRYVERVRAGLRNARAKAKKLDRPRKLTILAFLAQRKMRAYVLSIPARGAPTLLASSLPF